MTPRPSEKFLRDQEKILDYEQILAMIQRALYLCNIKQRVSVHLRQILFAERTVWIVVQAALQTLEAERVTAGSGDWLIKQSAGMEQKQAKF